ncbi:dehydrogenase [Rhizobium sp. NLR16b]|nr:dehydrogenase [Rhizobium sp. NLR16b]MBX5262100.1 dehydrogenase [Rhizobium sp. NLR16a]MBX5268410.1 dehydrogenase [Rhizobium sp. NLR17b]MBX5310666.1 dehydrogenase [Rhizobium sp. NLR11b]QTU98317.1 dehydrogenase [Rhizobium sp. NLR16a]
MKLAKILMLAALLSVLPACAALTRSDRLIVPPAPPKLVRPDSTLTARCLGPVDLGDKALTQAQLEKLWITDRERLLTCIRRHLALRDFYADRDGGLEAKP